MVTNYETFVTAHKDTLTAFTQFNTTLAGGLKEISNHVSSVIQSLTEMNLATGKAALTIKTPQELAAWQSDWASQFLNTTLSGSAKLSELSTKISTEAVIPVQAHLGSILGKIADKS